MDRYRRASHSSRLCSNTGPRERRHPNLATWILLAVACLCACDSSKATTDPTATCGNGRLEAGELCDGDCPTSCDDGAACTTDVFTGSAETCSAACEHAPIDACQSGDGCCPSAACAGIDDDCPAATPVCGDGLVEADERCDGDCPEACDDGLACTTDVLTGSAEACTAECSATPITACGTLDGCCPPGCDRTTDHDCAAICGNNVLESGERCDGNCPASCDDGVACTADSATGTAAQCDLVCKNTSITTCHDGDGCCAPGCNSHNDDDCSATCGDGVRDPRETCDGDCPTLCDDHDACTIDALVGSAAGCSAECSTTAISACEGGDGCCPAGCDATTDDDCEPQCGNGVLEAGEVCDGDCPSTCGEDGDACTSDVLTGSAASCNVRCTHPTITACAHGDGCCPDGCQVAADGDCEASCGTAADLCAEAEVACGPLSLTDACGGARSVSCGTCADGDCGVDGLVGQCRHHEVYDLATTFGRTVPVAPSLLASGANDGISIGAVGPHDVWIARGGTLLRVSGGVLTAYWLKPALGDIHEIHVVSPTEAWALAKSGVARFENGAWQTIAVGFTGTDVQPTAIGGASDDLFVAAVSSTGTQMRHFDGQAWTGWSVPGTGSSPISDIFVNELGKPWIARNRVYRWNGLSWLELPSVPGGNGADHVWVSATGTAFALTATGDGGYWSNTRLARLDAGAWTSLFGEHTSHQGCAYESVLDVQGSADDDVWFGDCRGRLHHFDGTAETSVAGTFGVSVAASGATFVNGSTEVRELVGADFVTRFDTGPAVDCTQGFADGDGRVWLVCDGALAWLDDAGLHDEGTADVAAIFAGPGMSVWLAKEDGVIERRPSAGGAAVAHDDFAGSSFLALAGTSDTDMWALTTSGGAAHWNGSTWQATIVPFLASTSLAGLAVSSTQVWAWSSSGVYRRQNGAWEAVPLPPSLSPGSEYTLSVGGLAIAGSDVWVSTYDYDIYRHRLLLKSTNGWTDKATVGTLYALLGGPTALTVIAYNDFVTRLQRWTPSGSTNLLELVDRPGGWLALRNDHVVVSRRTGVLVQFAF